MKRFEEIEEAIHSIERSIFVIKELPIDHYEVFGRVILWHLYNICEASLYASLAYDVKTNSIISLPEMKDLLEYNGESEMFISEEIKNAVKIINKYSIPDLRIDIDPFELYDGIQATKAFMKWIRGNTKIESIRNALNETLRMSLFDKVFAI